MIAIELYKQQKETNKKRTAQFSNNCAETTAVPCCMSSFYVNVKNTICFFLLQVST